LDKRQQVRDFISELLKSRGQAVTFSDDEDLVATGRLNSLAIIELVVYLENGFNLDLSRQTFRADLLGTPSKIFSLLEEKPPSLGDDKGE